MRVRRALRRVGVVLLVAALVALAPVIGVETTCRRAVSRDAREVAPVGITDAGYQRRETNSVLSYPEWYIVYAYQDLAGVLETRDEQAFDYAGSIAGFWTGLCGVSRVASAQGGAALDEKVMLYVIGLSFTAEMTIKGAWEETIGRFSAWVRGPGKTSEDLFVLRVAHDYAGFLQQTPWYEYGFAGRLCELLREVPFGWSSPTRAVERRVAMTAEWGVKAGYARVLGLAAGAAPAELRIATVVRGLDGTDSVADPRIVVMRDLGGGLSLIETPRYGAYTEIVEGLAARGREIVEIAGNHTVLVTVLSPPGVSIRPPGVEVLFSEAIQSRSGWLRDGLDVEVADLAKVIRAAGAGGAVFEHVYDY